MTKMKKKIWFVVAFLCIDLLSKLVAWIFLSPGNSIYISNDLSLTLAVNRAGFGTAIYHLGLSKATTMILLSGSTAAYSGGILLIAHYIKKKSIRVSMYCLSLLACGMMFSILTRITPEITLGATMVGIVCKFGSLSLAFVVLCLIKDEVYLVLWSLLLAAGIGNTLSLILPPFGTVDFIYSRFLNKLNGTGVFNLADLMVDIFCVGIAFYSVLLLVIVISRRVKTRLFQKKVNRSLSGELIGKTVMLESGDMIHDSNHKIHRLNR